MRRLLINTLERACRVTRHAGGCRLAGWSLDLDDRWQLGQWTGPNPKIKA